MTKAWSLDPALFAGKVEEDAVKLQRAIAIQILERIDFASPVDSGRFRNNNMVSLVTPDYSSTTEVDPSGAKALQRGIAVISKASNYGAIYIQNNLPYAEELERGHSKQAPTGVYANAFNGVAQAYK